MHDLALEALDLPVGESKRIRCPQCGAKDEDSMKITRHHSGVSAVCFRGKCGYRWYNGSRPSGQPDTKHKLPNKSVFDRPTTALTSKQKRFLCSKYGLTEKDIRKNRFKAQVDEPRLVMPILDPVGDIVGYVAKKMAPCPGRKSLTHWHKDAPPMHYPECLRRDGPVFIVEDTLSGVRVARHARTRVLLGTYLHPLAIEQLKRETNSIVLALDNDMVPKMVDYARKLRGLFDVRIVVWPKDPKDCSEEELTEKINEYL